jgi:molecular chaperone GrpE|tara:strand:- start:8 stop:658 length:651 start_codon:yes stop_codon:yes gene_type:complete
MEKENLKEKENNNQSEETNIDTEEKNSKNSKENLEDKDQEKDLSPEEEIEKLKDKLTRTFAEMENQRRRYEKEKDDAFEYGGFTFARESLNLLDNLERSKISLENDEKLKNTEILKKVIDHLNVIKKDVLSTFKKNNIEPIKSINEKLDPNLHQAMMEIEDDTKEPGTIIQEIQKGFMMKDRLLRPSLVGVSKKKLEKENTDIKKSEENKEKEEEK